MKVRRIITIVDETLIEGGREVSPAARTAVVAAIIDRLASYTLATVNAVLVGQLESY